MDTPEVDEARIASPTDPSDSVAGVDQGATPRSTMFAGKLLFWLPLAPLVALDLWSKYWVFDYLRQQNGGQPISHLWKHEVFATGWVEFELVTWLNRGTIWGLGADWHFLLKYLRVGAIALILWFVFKTPPRARLMLLALSLILAGALGNLYDNFIHFHSDYSNSPRWSGAVRDFIHFHNPGSWDFPAFNVADSCITVGAVTLFFMLWTTPPSGGSTARK